MKINKGYLPRITGRPASGLTSQEVISPLQIPICLAGKQYEPLVKGGQSVRCGQALAQLEISGGTLNIPAPYKGTVEQIEFEKGFLVLNVAEPNPQAWPEPTYPEPAGDPLQSSLGLPGEGQRKARTAHLRRAFERQALHLGG